MNSVSETKKIIASSLEPLPAVILPLLDAFGLALADDLVATIALPIANQATVDGYAIKFSDESRTLSIQDADKSPQPLNAGQAIPVKAGDPLPAGADTVVSGEGLSINDAALNIATGAAMYGMNVKQKGSDAAEGGVLMQKGERLSATAIGFLAGRGVAEVAVYRPPVVSIVNVATNHVEPGTRLAAGQSFEANTFLLRAAIRQCNLMVHRVFQVESERRFLSHVLEDAIDLSDIILITGCFDEQATAVIQSTVEERGIDGLVNSVKQSPGEALYFGAASNKAVFILPGGPASVMTCFYEYVVQSIEIMTKKKNIVPVIKASMAGPFQKPAEYTYFLNGNFSKGKVTPILSSTVSGIRSFISSNCLIVLPEEEINFQVGEEVEVHLLPW